MDIGCGPGYFTVGMSKMVGKTGRVIAVDLQEEMLAKAKKKARKHHVDNRIQFHQCQQDRIGLQCQADFILAFYMIHETPDPKGTLRELKQLLKPGGRLLVVEPKFHVGKELFQAMLILADEVALRVIEFPEQIGGRAVLFSA
jgi:ubiquinone/menaquinone biosynthesis C-methylase UbiE